jgi:hypothetical protein
LTISLGPQTHRVAHPAVYFTGTDLIFKHSRSMAHISLRTTVAWWLARGA